MEKGSFCSCKALRRRPPPPLDLGEMSVAAAADMLVELRRPPPATAARRLYRTVPIQRRAALLSWSFAPDTNGAAHLRQCCQITLKR